jgi:thiamine pyrophosphate-dependent acetolactate synthase large subunit-like protein
MVLLRTDALRAIDAAFADQPVVLTLGGTIREMLSVVGQKPNHLYILDSMGQPLAIGLGIAMGLGEASRHEKVAIVEGDGSLLMGFSSVATTGHVKPKNLVLVVLDNGVYLATGGQPTASASADYAAIALACGWRGARTLDDPDQAAMEEALQWARTTEGPILLRIKIGTQQPQTSFFLEDPVVLGRQFQDWLTAPA